MNVDLSGVVTYKYSGKKVPTLKIKVCGREVITDKNGKWKTKQTFSAPPFGEIGYYDINVIYEGNETSHPFTKEGEVKIKRKKYRPPHI